MKYDNKVAAIVPVAHLDLTRNDTYFMALSLACERSEYVSFFRERSREGKFVILDNSTIELGEPEPFEGYVRKAIEMEASQIVLPDWFKDASRTIDSALRAIDTVKQLGYKGQLMAVPQGRNIDEWRACCRSLSVMVDTLGVSYRYNEMFHHDRMLGVAAAFLTSLTVWGTTIHLLGCAGNPRLEVSRILPYAYVRGVDSSFAALITKYGQILTEKSLRFPGTRIDILNDEYDPLLLRANIRRWRALCSGEMDLLDAFGPSDGPTLSA